MQQAQSRLSALQHSVGRIQGVLKGFMGIFGTFFAGFAAFGIGNMIREIFSGASEAAEQADLRARSLHASLMQIDAIRKGGPALAQKQYELLMKENEAYAKQQVLGKEMLDIATVNLAKSRIPPKLIPPMVRGITDMLVAYDGVNASSERMGKLSRNVGIAIRTGMTRGLREYGIQLNNTQQKQFMDLKKQKNFEQLRYNFLMKLMQGYAGESARAMDSDRGRIRKLHDSIHELQIELGHALLPALGEMAAAWRELIEDPEIRGMLISSVESLGEALKGVAGIIRHDLIPMLKAVGESTAFKNLLSYAKQFAKQVKIAFDMMGIVAGAGAPYDKTPSLRRKAFAGMPGPYLPDISAQEKVLEPMRQLTGMDLFGLHVEKAKQFNVVMDKLPSSLMPSVTAMETWKAAGRDAAKVYDTLPAGAIESANSILNIMDSIENFDAQFTKWDAAAGNFVQNADQKFVDAATSAYTFNQKAGGIFDQIGGYIYRGFTQPFNDALTAFNSLKAAVEGGMNVPAAPTPTPTPHQFGGIFSRPHIGMVAESGPEAIIPLAGGSRSHGLLAAASRALGIGRSGGDTHVSFAPIVTINGPASESNQQALDDKLRNLARDFVAQFQRAQMHERRLSYESGYG